MKIFLTTLLILSTFARAEEITNTARVSISATLKAERDDANKERTETVGRYLEIGLRGASSITGNVKVVTVIFARKYPGKADIERESTKTVKLDANHSASFESQTERLTFTEEYEVRVKSKKKGNNKKKAPPRYKTVPAKGEKYTGWAVRVYQNGELLGEEASAQYLKLDP